MSLIGSNIATADLPQTTTSLSCAATTVAVNTGVVCTATVSVPNANGIYTWTTSGTGEFIDATPVLAGSGQCPTYLNSACSITFMPLSYTGPTVSVTATFGYDDSLGGSSSTITLNLTPASSTSTTSGTPTTAAVTSTASTQAVTASVSTVTSTQTVTTSTSTMSGYEGAGLVVVVVVLLVATFFLGRRGRTPGTPAKST